MLPRVRTRSPLSVALALALAACRGTAAQIAPAVLIPSDPAAELAQLARFGDVGRCLREERIVHDPEAFGGHRHEFSRRKPVPGLADHVAEIASYLATDSVRVAQRAVELLCAAGGTDAEDAIAALGAREPCLFFAGEALQAMGAAPRPNVQRALAAQAAALADDGCTHGANGTSCPPYARSRCAKELEAAGPDTVPGTPRAEEYARLAQGPSGGAAYRAFVEAAASRFPSRGEWWGARPDFGRREGATALAANAKRAGLTKAEVLRDATRGASASELDDLDEIAEAIGGQTLAELEALAPGEAKRKGLPPIEHAFWHEMAGDGTRPAAELCAGGGPRFLSDSCVQAERATTASLDDRLAAKDRRGLAAFMEDRHEDLTKRLLAAIYLLQLGDARGFPLLERMLVEGTAESELRPLAAPTLQSTPVPPALAPRFERLRAAVEKANEGYHDRQRALARSVTVP